MKTLLYVIIALTVQTAVAQQKEMRKKIPPIKSDTWYPVIRNANGTAPAFIDKTGHVKLALDSTCSFPFYNLSSNIFEGDYIVIEKKEGGTKKSYRCDRHGNLTAFPDGVRGSGMNGHLIVANNGSYSGLLTTDFTPITPFKYYLISGFQEGLALALLPNERFTFLDIKGKEQHPAGYVYAGKDNYGNPCEAAYSGISEGLSNYAGNGGLGVMDKNGKQLSPPKFSLLLPFHNGLAYTRHGDLAGYINKTGQYIIGPAANKYNGDFSDGLAPVKNDDGKTYSYMNTTGKIILAGKYYHASAFSHGYAVVATDSAPTARKQIIDTKGKVWYEDYFEEAKFEKEVIVLMTERTFSNADLAAINARYLDRNFKTIWSPDCSQLYFTNLKYFNQCDAAYIRYVDMASIGHHRYSWKDLDSFLTQVNPVTLKLYIYEDKMPLPSAITNMTNLEELHLDFCGITQIPETIGQLKNLRKLSLSNNNLLHIPESLSALKFLQVLDLTGNKVPKQEIDALQKKMPSLKIKSESPMFYVVPSN